MTEKRSIPYSQASVTLYYSEPHDAIDGHPTSSFASHSLNTQKGAQTLLTGEHGPGQTVTYTIKTTWIETLANHPIIFPSLGKSGTRCESNRHCLDQQLYLRDMRDEKNLISYRLDVSIEKVEHLADYVLLLTDGCEGPIRMFKLSPESLCKYLQVLTLLLF
ncbi:hypothetical protein PoB_005449600 [Plakobranchus ocellatus]|uniref:Cadherin domain-containing protein n=1 Tax=Plakobranchus ocellatus TaxID=259542 RepID=A0AAV4C9K1_9GAST|nr:hypothetical protein PoB_005449600 [Plakobranchus ocellatus]